MSIWIPTEDSPRIAGADPTRAKLKTFMVECYYKSEAERQLPDRIRQAGGTPYGFVEVPSFNYLGQQIGCNYAVVYQAEEELCVEVWT